MFVRHGKREIEKQSDEKIFEEIDENGDQKPKLCMVKMPSNIGKVGRKHEDIQTAVSVLNDYQNEIEKQIQLLQGQLEEVDE